MALLMRPHREAECLWSLLISAQLATVGRVPLKPRLIFGLLILLFLSACLHPLLIVIELQAQISARCLTCCHWFDTSLNGIKLQITKAILLNSLSHSPCCTVWPFGNKWHLNFSSWLNYRTTILYLWTMTHKSYKHKNNSTWNLPLIQANRFGRPGVDCCVQHERDVTIIQILFLVNEVSKFI